MSDNDVDRVLSGQGEIFPSSGFATSVMDAVHQEAATPAPIPFPWKRALPGLVACVLLVVFLLARLAHSSLRVAHSTTAALSMANISFMLPQGMASAPVRLGIEWSIVALLVSFLTVLLSMRIATEGE